MTIYTEVFPVAAICWVVVVVVIFVVDSKFVKIFPSEFPTAARAYPWMNAKRPFPISSMAIETRFVSLGHNAVESVRVETTR